MKTIGIIGGMSWESSLEYYRLANEITKQHLGGLHSSQVLMLSVDFAPIEKLQAEGRWEDATKEMIQWAQQLENGGADFILIATNTMHLMFPEVQNAVNVPLLHIADAAGENIHKKGIKTVGLLGTKFTMEMDFYSGRLTEKFGIKVLIPNEEDRVIVHNVIYQELVVGKMNPRSRIEYLRIIDELVSRGAEGIVLGCTEIPLLVKQKDTSIPLFDTTLIHIETAVRIALGEQDLA